MAKGDKHVVVLRDDAGQTYLLDDQTLEQSRVPMEQSGEVDLVLKDSELDQITGGAYTLVGSFSLRQTSALSIAQRLRGV